MQLSNDNNYKYIEELELLKNLLNVKFGSDLSITTQSYSGKHISQPAYLEALYVPKNFEVQIVFDSGRVNAVIKKRDAEIALHRYLLNQGNYNQDEFKFDDEKDNRIVLQHFIEELKKLFEDNNIYFYVWEGEKRYKVQGEIKKRLKTGQF